MLSLLWLGERRAVEKHGGPQLKRRLELLSVTPPDTLCVHCACNPKLNPSTATNKARPPLIMQGLAHYMV